MAQYLVYPKFHKRGALIREFKENGKKYVVVRFREFPQRHHGKRFYKSVFFEKTFEKANCRIRKVPGILSRWWFKYNFKRLRTFLRTKSAKSTQ